MKKFIVTAILLFTFSFAFCNTDKEIVIVRVEYSKKKDGYHSFLTIDIGKMNTHSLYRTMSNDAEGTVTYKDEDGKMKVFTTEVDLMNFLMTLGYNYQEVYTTNIMTETFQNFVLVKE